LYSIIWIRQEKKYGGSGALLRGIHLKLTSICSKLSPDWTDTNVVGTKIKIFF